jgi:hypothetical protein
MLAPFGFLGGAGIDAQAQAHYNRVIADGGLIPSGLVGVNNFFTTVKGIYGTSDITTAISVGLDAQVLGYKLGAGAGTTSGQAAQKLYSCSGSSGDVVQTTAASQPLLLVHSGANYFYTSGETGNYCSTPNAAANQITGDIEIICYNFNINDLTVSGGITGKYTGGNISWLFYYNGNNTFSFFSSQNGISQSNSASANAGLSINVNYTLKVVRQSVSGDVLFYKSTDNGATFTQIGSNVASTAGNLFNSTYFVSVGGYSNGSDICKMKIGRVTISNSIGGTPVVDFNPSQYNAATSQTQWTSSTGEVWTINTGTATSGYKGVLVDRTIVQGDGIDDRLTSGTLTADGLLTRYAQINPLQIAGDGRIVSGSVLSNVLLYKDGSQVRIFNVSGSAISFISPQNRLSQTFTCIFNGASSEGRLNNGTAATGNVGTTTRNTINIFTDSNGTFPSNAILTTLLESVNIDTSIQQTNIYNYIRGVNNL